MTTNPTTTISLLDRLKKGEKLISDGGSGTYLQAHGLEPGGSPELMNIEQPEVVRQMAADFYAAGSDMVLTNSFGGNRFGLERYGFGDRVFEFNKAAAELAKNVAPERKYVGGSIGPTGVLLEAIGGDYTEPELYDAFVEQVTGLAAGGADAIVIETMISTDEARLAIQAAKKHTDLILMATMTFDKGPRGYFTMMGDTPEDAVKILSDAGADIVGTNCGNGADVMIELIKRIRPVTDKPVLVHSNAGIPAIVKGMVEYPESPEFMAPRFQEMAELGASIIGGCCGTTPKHLAAFASSIKGA